MDSPNLEPVQPEPPVQPEQKEKDRPAVIINIGSLGTVWVALLMLVIGLALGAVGGMAGRPLISALNPATATTAPTAKPTVAVQQPGDTTAQPTADIMATVLAQVRHFRGDPNAPVTIIAFSDFQ